MAAGRASRRTLDAFDTYCFVIQWWLEDLPWLEADPTWDPDLFEGNSLTSPGTIRGRLFSLRSSCSAA